MQPTTPRPDPSAAAAINARLVGLSLSRPQSFGALTILPVIGSDIGDPPVLGTDALRGGHVVVEELDGAGVVAELLARNTGADAALFLLGDELLGGKQHRVVNTHFLIRPGSERRVPVSCIEAGRWHFAEHGRRGAFLCRREALSVHGSLRSGLARQTRSSLEDRGRATSDQGEVWREVDRFSSSRGVRSRTSALSEALDGLGEDQVEPELVAGQIGFAAWHGNRLVSIELFGSSKVLAAARSRLLRSAAASVGRPDRGRKDAAQATQELLARIGSADWMTCPGVSDGVEARAALGEVEIVVIIAQDGLVALSALAG